MKVGRQALVFVLLFAPLSSRAALDGNRAACLVEVAARKLAAADDRLAPGAYPKAISGSTWATIPAGGPQDLEWTQGFFPGSLWLVAEATGDAAWRARAAAWTAPLEAQKANRATHDVGFKLVPSFGRQRELTGDAHARDVLLEAAASLDSRYDLGAPVGAVKCCDWNGDWVFPVVVDTMMDLELLFWAAANGGPASYRDHALQHALTTARDLVRADGGTFHVADYRLDGTLRARTTYQGASDGSTWSRGESWALYGFATAYRYTGDQRMLDAARKVATYWLSRVPADGVPNWDFDSPRALKDSSAAAATASGLLALAALVDGAERARYESAALTALESLASPAYLDEGSSEALLLHGVGDLPHGSAIDVGLVYGDYYFLEALLRAFPPPLGACSATPGPGPTPTPGTPGPTPTPTATPTASPSPSPSPDPTTDPGGRPTAASSRGGCASAGEAGFAALLLAAAALGLRRIAHRPDP